MRPTATASIDATKQKVIVTAQLVSSSPLSPGNIYITPNHVPGDDAERPGAVAEAYAEAFADCVPSYKNFATTLLPLLVVIVNIYIIVCTPTPVLLLYL